MVIERGRLPPVTMPQLLTQLQVMQSSTNYVLLPLLPQTVIASRTFSSIPDIFDRLIVTEAHQLSMPLITRDQDIRTLNVVPTVWD